MIRTRDTRLERDLPGPSDVMAAEPLDQGVLEEHKCECLIQGCKGRCDDPCLVEGCLCRED